MKQYFQKMDELGKPLKESQISGMKDNVARIEEIMGEIDQEVERIKKIYQ